MCHVAVLQDERDALAKRETNLKVALQDLAVKHSALQVTHKEMKHQCAQLTQEVS